MNESFDKDLWIAAQMDRNDARLDLPRGGLPKPDAAWYEALDEEPASWPASTFYQGFDVSIREYMAAEADLVALLQDADNDGIPWCAKEWTYTVSVRTRYIFDHMLANFPWLAAQPDRADGLAVPAWFVEDGLAGWMESRAREMRDDADFCRYQRKSPRLWETRSQDKRMDSFHASYDEKHQAQQDLQQEQQLQQKEEY